MSKEASLVGKVHIVFVVVPNTYTHLQTGIETVVILNISDFDVITAFTINFRRIFTCIVYSNVCTDVWVNGELTVGHGNLPTEDERRHHWKV